MGIEFELKYRATDRAISLLLSTVPGEERHYDMETTYYDTPDSQLSARHYTLRRRKENEASICTLKYPVDGLGRGEVEVACESIEEALPTLCKLSNMPELVSLTAEGLHPVCGAKFHRIAKTFTWNGTTMELALDTGVLSGGGKELPLCEAEVELKEGAQADVQTYSAGLAAAFGLIPENRSKFRRALDLARGEKDHV